MSRFDDLSSVELRLELAEAEASRPATLRGICLKRNRIRDVTAELCERGAF